MQLLAFINPAWFNIYIADVNNSRSVNSTDVLFISRRYVHLAKSFSQPDLISSNPGAITISNSDTVENIKGMAVGDVYKSFSP